MAFALGVSENLLKWVRAGKGHPDPLFNPTAHYSTFLKVSDLLLHMGNELCATFTVTHDPIELDERVPFVTLDCVSGALRLENGNHRLASFARLGYVWFPVVVVIISTPGAHPIRHIPGRYQGCNDYDHARLWKGHERDILYSVFYLQQHSFNQLE